MLESSEKGDFHMNDYPSDEETTLRMVRSRAALIARMSGHPLAARMIEEGRDDAASEMRLGAFFLDVPLENLKFAGAISREGFRSR